MKTNVTLISKDRALYGVTIRQDTKNGFLSITDLQEAYTQERVKRGWADRRVERVLSTDDASERIYYILREQDLIKAPFSVFMDNVKKQSLVKYLKQIGVYKTFGARENKRVMCNKYLWLMIAMELNPEIYGKVIVWVGDNLITNRIEAGDRYNDLCRACANFSDVDYRVIAKGINYIVFNQHETLLRNKATEKELKEIDDLQKSLAFAVNMGYIKSFDNLIDEMRKLWHQKWDK